MQNFGYEMYTTYILEHKLFKNLYFMGEPAGCVSLTPGSTQIILSYSFHSIIVH